MNWESILTEIILSVLGIVFSALGGLVTYWISKKIKNEKEREFLLAFTELVKNSVLEVYQVYVEELKDCDLFDKQAQKKALAKAKDLIAKNMSPELEKWLKSNVSNFEDYIKDMIETQIALLKK